MDHAAPRRTGHWSHLRCVRGADTGANVQLILEGRVTVHFSTGLAMRSTDPLACTAQVPARHD